MTTDSVGATALPIKFCRTTVSPGRNLAICAPTRRAEVSVIVPEVLPLAVTKLKVWPLLTPTLLPITSDALP
jgi:hypothetical protein